MRIAAAWSWRILVVAGVVALVVFLVVAAAATSWSRCMVAILLAALLVPFSQLAAAAPLAEVARGRGQRGRACIVIVAGLIFLIVFFVRPRAARPGRQTSLAGTRTSRQFLLDSPLQLSEADINALR